MEIKWIVLGICGVTNGGKTTLASLCNKLLPNVTVLSQDDYFLLEDDPRHTLIPELNHINWELLTSLDMKKMHEDILNILSNTNTSPTNLNTKITDAQSNSVPLEDLQHVRSKLRSYNILVIEGFSIFNYEPIEKLCDLKFYLTLDRGTCLKRRSARVYNPADVPGYFDKYVWPEHVKQVEEVRANCKNVVYLNQENKNHIGTVFKHLLNFCNNLS